MEKGPVNNFQDYQIFGEFGGVNPSITDSSTFTFMTPENMEKLFEEEIHGCFLYSRHMNPANENLSESLAMLEDTEDALVTASGMSAISTTLLQLCQNGDEIVSSRTIYGGTYALMKNFFPKLGINTHFVNITSLDAIKNAITDKTKVIYCEAISNPLLEIADIREMRKIADEHNIALVVDNTFSPLCVTPHRLGAHIVIHSLTKFINGSSDCLGGAVCGTHEFISSMKSLQDGTSMLLGPVLDSIRSASILKNLRTLHLRMKQHSFNAMYVAKNLEKNGVKVFYPGLPSHPQHQLIKSMINQSFGYSGMITVDVGDEDKANELMMKMQEQKVGYFAVSLGFYKTLFSSPGRSTSSEIPDDEKKEMGMTNGLVRFSIGIDNDIERSYDRIKNCFQEIGMMK